MPELPHSLDRTVIIRAERPVVFRYFTDNSRWANWWGAGSTIDPKPGGKIYIRYPNGIEAMGEVKDVEAPESISFTFGYASGNPIAPGASLVTIQLTEHPEGTSLQLKHEFAEATARDLHVQGWRYQLSVFGNIVANESFLNVAPHIDRWFDAWAIQNDEDRQKEFSEIASPNVEVLDRNSLLSGIADVNAHASAVVRFKPGVVLKRKGEVRHCLGTALADWTVPGPDGTERLTGTSVFSFGVDGKIRSVVGFANAVV